MWLLPFGHVQCFTTWGNFFAPFVTLEISEIGFHANKNISMLHRDHEEVIEAISPLGMHPLTHIIREEDFIETESSLWQNLQKEKQTDKVISVVLKSDGL